MNASASPLNNPKYLWRNLSRVDAPRRSVTERLADFLEVYGCLNEQAAQAQASRCLQCPDAPCVEGCPMNHRIPEWMALVEEGKFQDAVGVLSNSGCMPDIVSRLCRQTCEQCCVLDGVGEPISINAIERFLDHYALENDLSNLATPPANGRRVAVVGSGPCGLGCALELVRAGFAVTVFDSHEKPGGFLVQGIPAYKLDQSLVQRRVRQLEQMGVEFRMNIQWGKDVSLQQLRAEYDAVFLGPCAKKTRPLSIPGADLKGVFQGLDFIIQRNFPWASTAAPIEVAGKRVMVLGGGDTASDCLRTAIRCGAREALGVYRRDQASMPCHPKEYEQAVEEGAVFQFSSLPVAVLGNASGQVAGVRCVRTQGGPIDETGRPEPVPVAGSEFEIPADIVLVAHGLLPPSIFTEAEQAELAVNEWGGVEVDDEQMTCLPGVFAAGVLVKPSLLLPIAVRDARRAAKAIEAYVLKCQPSAGNTAPDKS